MSEDLGRLTVQGLFCCINEKDTEIDNLQQRVAELEGLLVDALTLTRIKVLDGNTGKTHYRCGNRKCKEVLPIHKPDCPFAALEPAGEGEKNEQ